MWEICRRRFNRLMSMTPITEETIQSLSAAQRLEAARLLLNTLSPQGLMTTREAWSAPPVRFPDSAEESEDEDGEVEIDYSSMTAACRAAADAPDIEMAAEDRKAYQGLDDFSYTLDADADQDEAA